MESTANVDSRTAYLIIGHGREKDSHYDRVPEGCTLIVKASPCEVTYTNFRKFIRDPKHEKYLSPVINIDKIINRYGPVTIFQEGDIYPNLEYTLIAFNKHLGGKRSMMSSGIIEYPFYYGWQTFRDHEEIKADDKALEVLPRYFEHAMYPTKSAVEEEIGRLASIQGMRPHQIPIDLFIKLSEKYGLVFRISQKELFDKVRANELKPGPFYHFVCRSRLQEMLGHNELGQKAILPERRLNLFKTVNNPQRLAHLEELNSSISRQMMRGSLLEPMLREKLHEEYRPNKNTDTRRALKQQISEAHIHRRPYIKENYNRKQLAASGSSSGGGQKRKSRKQKKNT